MGNKSSPRDVELYQRVDEILHYMWDPIDMAGMPTARDEYYGYLPTVFPLLEQDDNNDEKIAAILRDWKTSIDEKYSQNT